MTRQKNIKTIPWNSLDEWKQVRETITRFEYRYKKDISEFYDLSGMIKRKMNALSSLMEDLCNRTCPQCKNICCIRATVWYDFKDLLGIYFGTNQMPDCQIQKNILPDNRSGCCHFSIKGCTLKRVERPFVCTWYICPAQKELLKSYGKGINQSTNKKVNDIKALRGKMDQAFINMVG